MSQMHPPEPPPDPHASDYVPGQGFTQRQPPEPQPVPRHTPRPNQRYQEPVPQAPQLELPQQTDAQGLPYAPQPQPLESPEAVEYEPVFDSEMRLDIMQELMPEFVEQNPTLTAEIASQELLDAEQFFAAMSQLEIAEWESEFSKAWEASTPDERLAQWKGLNESEREYLEGLGYSPPSENWLGRLGQQAWEGFRDHIVDPHVQILALPFQAMERAKREMDRWWRGALLAHEDEVFADFEGSGTVGTYGDGTSVEPHHHPDYQDRRARIEGRTDMLRGLEGSAGDSRILGGIASGMQGLAAGVTTLEALGDAVGSLGRALRNPGRWREYYQLGGADGEEVFWNSAQERIAAQHGLDDTGMDLAKRIASHIPADQLRHEELGEDLYRQALMEAVSEVVPGDTENAMTNRSVLFGMLAENETFRESSLELAGNRISIGRVAALKAGFEPGSEGYHWQSGYGDAMSLMFADPTIIGAKVRSVQRVGQYGIRGDKAASARKVHRIVNKKSLIPGARHPVERVLDDVGQAATDAINIRLAREAGATDDIMPGVTQAAFGANRGYDRIAKRQPLWGETFERTVDDLFAALNRQGDELVDGVRIVRNEHGIRHIEGQLDHHVIGKWLATDEGLKAIKRGAFGGHLWGAPMMPADTTFHLLFKGPKRAMAGAIDWVNDTPYRMAQNMERKGLLQPGQAQAERLGLHLTVPSVTRASRAAAQNEGVARGVTTAAAGLGKMPISMAGRFMHSLVNTAAKGPVNLTRDGFANKVRQYTAVLPAEMRARFANEAASTRDPGQRLMMLRNIHRELFEVTGLNTTVEGRRLGERMLREFDDMASGLGGHHQYAASRSTSAVTDVTGEGLVHAGIFPSDLATHAPLPNLAAVHSIAKRSSAMEKAFDPVGAATQADKLDWFMSRVWRPGVLFRLSFPIRTSGDEFGLSVLREGGAGMLKSRMVMGALQEKQFVPSLMRPDRSLMRMLLRRVPDDVLARSMRFDSSQVERFRRYRHAARPDEVWSDEVGGYIPSQQPVALDTPEQAMITSPAAFSRTVEHHLKRSNPYEVLGNVLSERSSNYAQWVGRKVHDVRGLSDRASRKLRRYQRSFQDGFLGTAELTKSAKRMLMYDESAGRHVPRTQEFMASSYRGNFHNPAKQVNSKELPFHGGGAAPHPEDRRLDLVVESYATMLQDDPQFLEQLAANISRHSHDPVYRRVSDLHLELAPRLNRGELTMQQYQSELRRRLRKQLMNDPEFRAQWPEFQRSTQTRDGRRVLPDHEVEALSHAPGSEYATARNTYLASRRSNPGGGPDGPSPGTGGGPVGPGDGGGHPTPGGPAQRHVAAGSDEDTVFHEARHAVADELDAEFDQLHTHLREQYRDELRGRGYDPSLDEIPEEVAAPLEQSMIWDDPQMRTLLDQQGRLFEGTPEEVGELITRHFEERYGRIWNDWYQRSVLEHPPMREVYWRLGYERMRAELESVLPAGHVDELFTRLGLLDARTGRETLESLFQDVRARNYVTNNRPAGNGNTDDVIADWVRGLRATDTDGTELEGLDALRSLMSQRARERQQLLASDRPDAILLDRALDPDDLGSVIDQISGQLLRGNLRLDAVRQGEVLRPTSVAELDAWMDAIDPYLARSELGRTMIHPQRVGSDEDLLEAMARLDELSIEHLHNTLADFQAMTPPHVKQTYERLWASMTSELPDEWYGLVDNVEQLPPAARLIARMNERIHGQADLSFDLTPAHVEMLRTYVRDQDPEAVASMLRGNPHLGEYRNILDQREGAWAQLATNTDRAGVDDGLGRAQARLRRILADADEDLGLTDLDTDAVRFLLDEGNVTPEFIEAWQARVVDRLAGEDPRLAQATQRMWHDLANDEEYLAARRAEDPAAIQREAMAELRHLQAPELRVEEYLPLSGTEGETRGALRVLLEDVVGQDGDLARLEELDVLLLSQRVRDNLGDELADQLHRELASAAEYRRFMDLVGDDPLMQEYPEQLLRANEITSQLADGALDEGVPFAHTPLHYDELNRYLDYQRGRVASMGDEVFEDVDNFAKMQFGQQYRRPTDQELEEFGPEMFGLTDDDVVRGATQTAEPDSWHFPSGARRSGSYGDGGGGSPPTRGADSPMGDDDGWLESTELADMLRARGLARESEALDDHVEAMVEAWQQEMFSSPDALARQFEQGTLTPRDGANRWWRQVTDEGTGEVRYEELATADDFARLTYEDNLVEAPARPSSELDPDAVAEGTPLGPVPDEVISQFRKPITGEDRVLVEQQVERVLANMRGSFQANGRDPSGTPATWEDFVELVNGRYARGQDLDVVREVREGLEAVHGEGPITQAYDRLLAGGGSDPQAFQRSIGDDLIEQINDRVRAGEAMAVTPEELEGIGHQFLPGSVYGPQHTTKRRDILAEAADYGFGEVLLPVVDTISREPMLLHYYARGERNVRDVVLNARREGRILDTIEATRVRGGSRFDAHEPYDSAKEVLEDVLAARARYESDPEQMAAALGRRFDAEYQGPGAARARELELEGWEHALLETEEGRWVVNELIPEVIDTIGVQEGETLGQVLQRGLRRTINAERDIHDQAMTEAASLMARFSESEAVGSLFAQRTRNIFPFWWAEERFLKRYAMSAYASPENYRKAQLVYKGFQSTGWMEEDDYGNDIFVYPFGESVHEGTSWLMEKAFGRDVLNVPQVHRMTGQLQWSMPGLTTHGRPLPGPVGAIPVRILRDRFPELETPADAFLGEFARDDDRAIHEQFYPPMVNRILSAVDTERAKEEHYAQLINVLNYMHANELVPPDDASAEEHQEFQDRLTNWAQVLATEKAIYGFVGVAPPQVDVPEGAMDPEFREMVAELGNELGIEEFMRRHPDADIHTMFGTRTVGGGPIPATEETYEFLNANEDFFATYDHAGSYLIPDPEFESEFYNRAWQKQMALGLRQRHGHDQADWLNQLMRDFYFQAAADDYFDSRQMYEDMREPLSGTSEAVELDSLWSDWVDQYHTKHPIFAQELQSRQSAERRETVLSQLRDAFADERLPRTERANQLEQLVHGFDEYQQMRVALGRGNDNATRAARERLRTGFVTWGQQMVDNNPEGLRHFWHQIMLPELNTDRDEIGELMGREPLNPVETLDPQQ